MITILLSDTKFAESPLEGDPKCLCSRCHRPVGEDEFALRAWPEDGRYEIRFCEACQEGMGIQIFRDEQEEGI